ncbi:MAG: hypothetical protein CME70_03730 [Halobacteriovorax sp.]|nr:hypothetical protein [Halobacteriovorax sp.]|tara:strand:+ start:182259 stop:185798 length:3540 start_codon:yes stop_codon:yes gene_type:complete
MVKWIFLSYLLFGVLQISVAEDEVSTELVESVTDTLKNLDQVIPKFEIECHASKSRSLKDPRRDRDFRDQAAELICSRKTKEKFPSNIFIPESESDEWMKPLRLLQEDRDYSFLKAIEKNDFDLAYGIIREGKNIDLKEKNEQGLTGLELLLQKQDNHNAYKILLLLGGSFIPDFREDKVSSDEINKKRSFYEVCLRKEGISGARLGIYNQLNSLRYLNEKDYPNNIYKAALSIRESHPLAFGLISRAARTVHLDRNKELDTPDPAKYRYEHHLLISELRKIRDELGTSEFKRSLKTSVRTIDKYKDKESLSEWEKNELASAEAFVKGFKDKRLRAYNLVLELKEKQEEVFPRLVNATVKRQKIEKALDGKSPELTDQSTVSLSLSSQFSSFFGNWHDHRPVLSESMQNDLLSNWFSNNISTRENGEVDTSEVASRLAGKFSSGYYAMVDGMDQLDTEAYEAPIFLELDKELNDDDYLASVLQAYEIVRLYEAEDLSQVLDKTLDRRYQKAKELIKEYESKESLYLKENNKTYEKRIKLISELSKRMNTRVERLKNSKYENKQEVSKEELREIINSSLAPYKDFLVSTKEDKLLSNLIENELKKYPKRPAGELINSILLKAGTFVNSDKARKNQEVVLRKKLISSVKLGSSEEKDEKINYSDPTEVPQVRLEMAQEYCQEYFTKIEPIEEIDCSKIEEYLNGEDKGLFSKFKAEFRRFARRLQSEIYNPVKEQWKRLSKEVKRQYHRTKKVVEHPKKYLKDEVIRLVSAPVTQFRVENLKLAYSAVKGTVTIGVANVNLALDQLDKILEPAQEAIGEVNEWCTKHDCPDIGVQCTDYGGYVSCVATDSNGNPSEIPTTESIDWDQALGHMKKMELQDMLQNMKLDMEGMFERGEEHPIFPDLAQVEQYSQLSEELYAEASRLSDGFSRKPASKEEEDRYKAIMRFLKGVGTGAYNNIADAIASLGNINLNNLRKKFPKMVANLMDWIIKANMDQVLNRISNFTEARLDAFVNGTPEEQGQMIGSLMVDIGSFAVPVGVAGKLGVWALRAGKGGKATKAFSTLVTSARKLGMSKKFKYGDFTRFKPSSINPVKVGKQMKRRGWTNSSIGETINKPHQKFKTRDVRHNSNGARMNDPATGYVNRDGSYIVRNDRTGDIVQLSDRSAPSEWLYPDWHPKGKK